MQISIRISLNLHVTGHTKSCVYVNVDLSSVSIQYSFTICHNSIVLYSIAQKRPRRDSGAMMTTTMGGHPAVRFINSMTSELNFMFNYFDILLLKLYDFNSPENMALQTTFLQVCEKMMCSPEVRNLLSQDDKGI